MAPRLTVQVQLVVQALLRDPARELYGLELSEETGLQPGTAYAILLRLEQEGWVASRWEVIDPRAEKRPARRYYRLTAGGAVQPRTGPRRDRVKKQGIAWLAGAGMWIAVGVGVAVPPGLAGWVRVTFACCMGLTALSFIAVYRGRSRRTGNGLNVHGRDDDDGPAGLAVHQRHTLRMLSLLMPGP